MFVALALTNRRRGMESAPALVGAMASAARRSWSQLHKRAIHGVLR